jgi:glycosyltransferase involved in cell wall biosynthesis
LAAGLPVVTSVNNGAAEILEEGVTGSTIREFWKSEIVASVFEQWAERRVRVQVPPEVFSLERNVRETLAVLELAAKEGNS